MERKAIPGTDYRYYIDEYGNVVSHTSYGDVVKMKQKTSPSGKKKVSIVIGKKLRHVYIHHLVAISWLTPSNRNKGFGVRHIDGDYENNHHSNLEFVPFPFLEDSDNIYDDY